MGYYQFGCRGSGQRGVRSDGNGADATDHLEVRRGTPSAIGRNLQVKGYAEAGGVPSRNRKTEQHIYHQRLQISQATTGFATECLQSRTWLIKGNYLDLLYSKSIQFSNKMVAKVMV